MIICSLIWTYFLILAVITSKYRKMKTTLHSYFFARNLNLQSELNKAVYTATSVACFWAGAVTRPYTLQQALAESLLIASSAEKALSC